MLLDYYSEISRFSAPSWMFLSVCVSVCLFHIQRSSFGDDALITMSVQWLKRALFSEMNCVVYAKDEINLVVYRFGIFIWGLLSEWWSVTNFWIASFNGFWLAFFSPQIRVFSTLFVCPLLRVDSLSVIRSYTHIYHIRRGAYSHASCWMCIFAEFYCLIYSQLCSLSV